MKYKYSEKDFDLISWERIDKFIDKIYSEVLDYITKNNLKIRYIAPILRGGGVPAIKLSHMFDVIDMLPMQLKYNLNTKNIDTKLSLDYIQNSSIKQNECILLVEGNQVTGRTANIAVEIIRKKFGKNVKIINVSLTRDYSCRNSVKNVCFSTWGMSTNELKEISREDCEKLSINYNLISLYPWENIEEELCEINNYLND